MSPVYALVSLQLSLTCLDDHNSSTLPIILESLPINAENPEELIQSALVIYDTQAVSGSSFNQTFSWPDPSKQYPGYGRRSTMGLVVCYARNRCPRQVGRVGRL